jgi:UDP-N-acetyl-D-galactosamine dehydrogenase
VLAVGHRQFRELGVAAVRRFARRNHVLYDIKYVFERHQTDGRL